jgi:multiple sugar transport system ATP-binding protein
VSTIQFENVSKQFGDVAALTNISFAVGDGEFVVLVGPSGCGKSTALRLVAGLDEPDSGCILIDATDMLGVAPKARGCAMVFQAYALYPHWTVFDNLAFPLRLRRVPRGEIRRRVTAIAADLQLDAVLDRRPKALSGGQRQRVALGRALAADPSILLFDEPLSNLDAPLRASMRTEIAARQRKLKKTTLYVTHDQAEALTMADRVVVLNGGRVQGIGPPEQLYRDPPNRFVATFLGRPSMNLILGEVQRQAEGYLVNPPGWPLPELNAATPSALAGRTVEVGVRPEHLRLDNAGSGGAWAIAGREFLGDKTVYYAAAGDTTLTILTESHHHFDTGATVTVEPDPGNVLLFDPASGERIR